jgi:uncharacterized protein YukE
MNNDTRLLVAALDDYQSALARQKETLRSELDPLLRAWSAFSAVYEGTAADHFRAGWFRAQHMLEDYLATADRLQPVLRERLEALREADRPSAVVI